MHVYYLSILVSMLIFAALHDARAQEQVQTRTPAGILPIPHDDSKLIKVAALNPTAPPGLSQTDQRLLGQTIMRLRTGDTWTAKSAWSQIVQGMKGRRDAPEIETLIGHVLCRAFFEGQPELKARGEKVKYYDDQLRAARAYQTHLERYQLTLKHNQTVRVRTLDIQRSYTPGVKPFTIGATKPMDIDSVTHELQAIVELRAHAEESARLAGADLRNTLRKHPQLHQAISGASTMLRETAKAVISNVR